MWYYILFWSRNDSLIRKTALWFLNLIYSLLTQLWIMFHDYDNQSGFALSIKMYSEFFQIEYIESTDVETELVNNTLG